MDVKVAALPEFSSYNETHLNVKNDTATMGLNSTFQEKQYQQHSTFDANLTFQNAVLYINLIGIPVILATGVIFNNLCVLSLVCSHLKLQIISVYLVFLAIVDTGFLFSLSAFYLSYIGLEIINREGLCPMIHYLRNVSSMLSVWTLVILTIERSVIVFQPVKNYVINTRRRALFTVVVLTCLALIINIYYLKITGVRSVNNFSSHKAYCLILPQYQYTYKIIVIFETIIRMIVPLVLILFLNGAIAIKVRKFVVSSRKQAMLKKLNSLFCNDDYVDGKLLSTELEKPKSLATVDVLDYNDMGNVKKEVCHQNNLSSVPPYDNSRMAQMQFYKYRYKRKSNSFCKEEIKLDKEAGNALNDKVEKPKDITEVQCYTKHHLPRHLKHDFHLRTTRALMFVSLSFLILHLPFYTLQLYSTIRYISDENYNFPSHLALLQQLFLFLYSISFSTNCLVYGMCNRSCRFALYRLLNACFCNIKRK